MIETGGRARGYHHGDLRNALVAAALELAAEGGPGQVVLREAARRVGVSATAAYRHFTNHGQLLAATKNLCQQALADALEEGWRAEDQRATAAGGPSADRSDADRAVHRVMAIGRAYVRFALENPGLFRTAFTNLCDDDTELPFDGVHASDAPEFRAFNHLSESLDKLVETGAMPVENRPLAEIPAWAAVHGVAVLILDGPLANLPPDDRDAMIDQVVNTLGPGLLR